jgi:flagella basal body P-ring formation protein FlgA
MKKISFVLGIMLLTSHLALANASQYQSITSIQAAVRHYIALNIDSSTDYKETLGHIDTRLKLPQCDKPLNVFTQKATLKAGRNSIGVKCISKKKWTIYTSAIIKIYKDVIVLSQPIKRGEFYRKNSLQLQKREISSLRSGFFTNPTTIIDKQASRNLNIGAVVTQSNVTEPKLVKRGEKVTIKISSPNLEISVAGVALMDGIKNQNIRVKNINSKQIVQATVEKQGQVVVSY